MKFFKACKTVLEGNVKKKSVLIGRIAGQYAKPRSS
jgi:3-deoxy-D-arabino-heptulosonate 7-phosphate (DAHP) synthase class II